jgi:hypothetical protein
VDLEVVEGVDWGGTVLPDISNYVVELAGFEEVYWVW